MNPLEKDSISRLAVAFLENDPSLLAHGDKAFDVIETLLCSYSVAIFCGDEIIYSVSQQAALLTAINVGKRCYKGGVFVYLKKDTPCVLNWPNAKTLNQIVEELGAINSLEQEYKPNIYKVEIILGTQHDASGSRWRLLVNNWNTGITPPGVTSSSLLGDQNFPLGGILGGALSIGLTFLKIAGFDHSIGFDQVGLSLWRPDLSWDNPESNGPEPLNFPSKIWMLGLGHLGQAYTWAIGLIPFQNPSELFVKNQDDDRIVKGNYDSGMLSEKSNVGEYKTRICSNWLEERGITTRIVERKYDENYHRQVDDPEILLVGVDKLHVRKLLKTNEFKLVLDCGLGSGLNFDMIRFNVFPNLGKSSEKLWENAKETDSTTPALKELSQKIIGCGYTVGIASAFTGCVSACLALSEVLRSYNQGMKLTHYYLSIRELLTPDFKAIGYYRTETFSGNIKIMQKNLNEVSLDIRENS